MRWTRPARRDERCRRGRRSRVVLTPRRWRQVGGSNSADDGGKQARSPGRARRKPLKPLRGECRVIPGVTVVTNARAFYTTRAAAGASSARHSLRPLISWAEDIFTTRAKRAAGTRRRVWNSTSLRGAKRRSNPLFLCAAPWIASRSLSSGGALRRPVGSQ
jgi:hypothetical protein